MIALCCSCNTLIQEEKGAPSSEPWVLMRRPVSNINLPLNTLGIEDHDSPSRERLLPSNLVGISVRDGGLAILMFEDDQEHE